MSKDNFVDIAYLFEETVMSTERAVWSRYSQMLPIVTFWSARHVNGSQPDLIIQINIFNYRYDYYLLKKSS